MRHSNPPITIDDLIELRRKNKHAEYLSALHKYNKWLERQRLLDKIRRRKAYEKEYWKGKRKRK